MLPPLADNRRRSSWAVDQNPGFSVAFIGFGRNHSPGACMVSGQLRQDGGIGMNLQLQVITLANVGGPAERRFGGIGVVRIRGGGAGQEEEDHTDA